MAYLGDWQIADTLTLYVQTVNPDTGAAWAADVFPTYRIYHLPTGTPIATGTYAQLAATNATGLYAALVPLTTPAGFQAGATYGVRTAVTIVGALEAFEDQFTIPANPLTIVPARVVWRAVGAATQRIITVTPARIMWQPLGASPRTVTITPARLVWHAGDVFPQLQLFPPVRWAWAAQPMQIAQDFPFRETTAALTFLPD